MGWVWRSVGGAVPCTRPALGVPRTPLTFPSVLTAIAVCAFAAKNIALAGVKSLTVHDTRAASMGDLSSQFYLTEEHVRNGTNRWVAAAGHFCRRRPSAEWLAQFCSAAKGMEARLTICAVGPPARGRAIATMPRLAELNPYTSVVAQTEPELSPEMDMTFFADFEARGSTVSACTHGTGSYHMSTARPHLAMPMASSSPTCLQLVAVCRPGRCPAAGTSRSGHLLPHSVSAHRLCGGMLRRRLCCDVC